MTGKRICENTGGSDNEQKSSFAEVQISILTTSIYYFLDFAFIISDGNCYRLVVIHNSQLLTDNTYKTLKGAKIAFSRIYGYKVWHERIKPNWSDFYNPTNEWLDERWKVIRQYPQGVLL